MKLSGFEILPHTVDMRMRVWGKTLKDLFRGALEGVASYLKPDFFSLVKRIPRTRKAISAEAVDINSLLVAFLSEVVAQSDIHNMVFTGATFKELGENFLEGELLGVPVDEFEHDIKAVSYHEVDIKKNPETGFYETMLVFDI